MGICQFEILVYNMTHIETVENRVKRTVSRDCQPGFGETKKLNLGPPIRTAQKLAIAQFCFSAKIFAKVVVVAYPGTW